MNIGVIGGSGFVGSHVVDRLVEHGHEVTVFDIMRPHRDDVRHIYIDITDLSKTCVALGGAYDAVYMLAAMADVNDVYRNPVEAGEVNILAVANVLEAARRSGIGRVILASTVWVYEMAQDGDLGEDTSLVPSKTGHVYTASKVAAELYCHAYQRLYDQGFTILRYGIPYGPRARGDTVIALFVRKALSGQSLTIFGDGSQYRNFIYVEDLAEGNVAALSTVARNQTYNLEGPRPVTIREIAERVVALVGNVAIEYREARPGDYGGGMVLAEKARSELGWQPTVDFEEGMRRYIEWYRGALGGGGA
ncbi:MAG: NAD-dependent epimerase/dehydratase family protein [Chloroflexota bacterium]|nr:NAD-dependent epimerase/dehydratase family protein [Chloroflexota bacterium]